MRGLLQGSLLFTLTDSTPPETEYFCSENDTVLSNEERDSIEGSLTELECSNALKDMDPEKTPGTDGFPSEFYQNVLA